jgi:hypothetical protein
VNGPVVANANGIETCDRSAPVLVRQASGIDTICQQPIGAEANLAVMSSKAPVADPHSAHRIRGLAADHDRGRRPLLGVQPASYDPLVAGPNFPQVLEIMRAMRNQVAHDVRNAPSHDSYFAAGAAAAQPASDTSRLAGSSR